MYVYIYIYIYMYSIHIREPEFGQKTSHQRAGFGRSGMSRSAPPPIVCSCFFKFVFSVPHCPPCGLDRPLHALPVGGLPYPLEVEGRQRA